MQIWQAVTLSAGVTNGRCPTDNTFIFADARLTAKVMLLLVRSLARIK
jgi:hypothetical protein